MDLAEFVALVARMRAAQVRYFKTRDHTALRESKDAERRVDDAIDQLTGKGDNAPSLF